MYIVKFPFKYKNTLGKSIEAKVGDTVPDFEKWPYVCQKAHLNLDWVVKIDEPAMEESFVNPIQEKVKAKGRSSKK